MQKLDQSQSPWSFQSGHLALDFANTADWHASGKPDELLTSYERLAQWATDFGVLEAGQAKDLQAIAGTDLPKAARTLSAALDLREKIFRIFSAIALEAPPEQKDIQALIMAWTKAAGQGELVRKDNHYAWRWPFKPGNLEQITWPVAVAAAELLRSGNLAQVGRCADDRGCGMLFIDTSRNHSRQWCSMETCGNRAKAKRHYLRKRK